MTKLPRGGFHGGDVYAYRWLARHVPVGGTMVELGSYVGRSICSVAEIIRERQLRTTIIDKFVGLPADPHTTEVVTGTQYEDPAALRAELGENLVTFGLDAVVAVVDGDSADGAAAFADGSVDLAFLDADHQLDGVLRDLNAWWPKISPTGRIAGHDYVAEFEHPRSTSRYGRSGGYAVAPALHAFFKHEREIKRVPRQNQTTIWYVNRDPGDDLVVEVLDTEDLERSLRTHLRPEGETGVAKRRRILDVARQLGHPTRDHLVYTCSTDPQLRTHLSSSAWFVTKLLQSQHLQLVPRRFVDQEEGS